MEHGRRSALALGALGVVFGDIGTSPLYAMQAAFGSDTDVGVTHANVLGLLSLFLWTLVIVVTLKYVAFVMRANNRGEGGVLALLALALRRAEPWERGVIVTLGLLGVALFYGDGAITPAISVLSAVEGTQVATSDLHRFIVPITLVVLTGLFMVQRHGTHRIGAAFGPVMAVWFVTIAALGINGISREPSVFRAIDPLEAASFFGREPWVAFVALGAVVLCITGVEALYADMGHFGRPPIAGAWLVLVFPCLVLCYLGQGATILHDPATAANPFFNLAPDALKIPLVILATVATVIASQAVITGAFSVTQQATQLGYLPRVTIFHTSEQVRGQIYAPAINWLLYVAVVLLVLGFETSSALAAAYGIAVTGTMAATTVLAYVVTRRLWGWSGRRSALVVVPLLTIDLAFFGSNLLKVHHGGWFPLLLGGGLFVLMTTWDRGRAVVTQKRIAEEGPLQPFVTALDHQTPPIERVPGMAVYLNASDVTTPLALRHNVRHNHVRHEHIVIFRAVTADVPHVERAKRVQVDDLGHPADGVTLVTGHFGFRDVPNVPDALALAATMSPELKDGKLDEATYFLSKVTIHPSDEGSMLWRWRKRLFAALARNASSPAEYFGLPEDQVIALGSQIEV